MLDNIFRLKAKIAYVSTKSHVVVTSLIDNHQTAFLFISGVCLLTLGLSEIAVAASFNDDEIKEALCDILKLVEGSFGALIMAVAGLGAIVSAAVGGYRTAMSCVVISCGAMITRSVIILFFGEGVFDRCNASRVKSDPVAGN